MPKIIALTINKRYAKVYSSGIETESGKACFSSMCQELFTIIYNKILWWTAEISDSPVFVVGYTN